MTNLTILSNKIRTNGNLYSLNDLHLASGNDPKHRPTYFIRNEQTQELVAELKAEKPTCENSHSSILVTKNAVGTYACEELALAYATWISPKFHLVVLRAFIAMHRGELQNQPKMLPVVEPEPTYTVSVDRKLIHNLVWLAFSHEQMRSLLGLMIKPLEALGSRYTGTVYSHHQEYQRHYQDCLPFMRCLVTLLKQDNPLEWERLSNRLEDSRF